MAPHSFKIPLVVLLTAAAVVPSIFAQIPLVDKRFDFNNLPFQVDTDTGERGTQFGYNLCNSTTEGPTSKCQTMVVNSLEDFCLWGPPEPFSISNQKESIAVAWCTKPGHGTRLIPAGAFSGLQFMKTPGYVQITGYIKQEYINLDPEDSGGETDPHGQDRRGNPLGGLVFSNSFRSSVGTFKQAVQWHSWVGAGAFCFKACDPTEPNASRLCEHIYDRIGCPYNAPAAYKENVFESCDGENQDPVGQYIENGVVKQYSQPSEAEGPLTSMPYVARIPASSNCVPQQSAELYADAPKYTPATRPESTAASTGPSRTSSVTRTRAAGATSTVVNSDSTRLRGNISGVIGFIIVSLIVLGF